MAKDPKASAIVADLFERAAWTTAQQFLAVLLTTTTAARVGELPWKLALGTGLGAGLISLLTTFGQRALKWTNLGFWPDLGLRMAKTFAASLVGTVGADVFNVFELDWASAANVAVVATVIALGKGVLSRNEPSASVQANPSSLSAEKYALACAT